MLNLLFISDSPKIEYIKKTVQPLLKVIIDVVPDFDNGLKDVFEKRPAIVFIQDQIAGVTGENVARHIQMLLGNSAPTFILIHEGSSKAKQIKGLFEYTVDLNQPEAKLAVEIQSTLKVLIGDQWDNFIAPSTLTPTSITPLPDLSEESRDDSYNHKGNGEAEPQAVQKPSVADTASKVDLPDASAKQFRVRPEITEPKQCATPATRNVVELPTPVGPTAGTTRTVLANVSHFPPVTSADLFISHKGAPAEKRIPEEKPPAFEENHHLKSKRTKYLPIYIFVLLVFVSVGGWYLVQRKPDLTGSLKQRSTSVVTPNTAPTVNPSLPVAQPVPNPQKPIQSIVEKPSGPSTAFPAFIPLEGHDKTFSGKNPGWERYIGEQVEFRLFNSDDKTRAVQILAIKDNVIPDSLVKTVLTELAGSADYKINTREKKSGFLILRGTVAQKADVIFYYKDSAVRAFVVSLF